MKMFVFCLALFLVLGFPEAKAADLVIRQSAHSVSETMSRLVKAIEAKGLKIFLRIDHAKGAQSVGQSLKPTQVILFGHPKLGTALIKASPEIGLDLPLKILVYEDTAGKTWLVHASAETLKARYNVKGADQAFLNMAGALKALVSYAVK